MPIKVMKGRRPDPSLFELHQMQDSILHDMFDAFKESITRGQEMNLPIEEDHAPIFLWRSVCARYHKLKELEVKKKLLQHCEERVSQLSHELKVDERVVPEITHDFASYNFSVLSEEEVQPRKKTRRKPTFKEIEAESDFNLQFLWTAFKQSIAEAEKKRLSLSEDNQSALLLRCVYQRYFNIQDQRKGSYVSANVPEEKPINQEPMSVNCSVLGEQEMSWFLGEQISMGKETFESDRKMVSEIQNKDLPMVSCIPEVTSFRFEENNEDHFLHNISCESHPLVCTQAEYETFKFEEDDIKNDFRSSQVYDDPVLESFSFDESAKLKFPNKLCIDGKAGSCFSDYQIKSEILVEEKGVRTDFVQRSSVPYNVLQHHKDDEEPDYIFLCHEMEVNQSLVPAEYKSSSTTDSSIEVLNLDRDFSDLIATRKDEVTSVQIDPMCDEESFYFSLDLKSKSSIQIDYDKCAYDGTPFSEPFEYPEFFNIVSDVEISIKNDVVERDEGDCVPVPDSKSSYFSSSQKMIDGARSNVQEGMDESEIYDEGWLFGRDFWATYFQHTSGFNFDYDEVTKGEFFWFNLLERNFLFQKGSYFSLPVNGHV